MYDSSDQCLPTRSYCQSRSDARHLLMLQAFSGLDTDPTCAWLIDYLVRMPPWEGVYSGQKRQRGSHGASADRDNGSGSGSDEDDDRERGPKRQRRLQRKETLQGNSTALGRCWSRFGSGPPSSRRVMALPYGGSTTGNGDCVGLLADMPAPRELDYDTELSKGFAIGLSHYNSHVFATRCGISSML